MNAPEVHTPEVPFPEAMTLETLRLLQQAFSALRREAQHAGAAEYDSWAGMLEYDSWPASYDPRGR